MSDEYPDFHLPLKIGPKKESAFARELVAMPGPTPPSPDDRVTILVRDPGHDWWTGGWFAPRSASAEAQPAVDPLRISQAALQRYRPIYDERAAAVGPAFPFPYRLKLATATRLPAYLRGWLAQPLSAPPISSARLNEITRVWLDTPYADGQRVALALFGAADWQPSFPQAPQVSFSTLRVPPGDPRVGDQGAISRFHLVYQQWFKDFPVFGGQVAVHLTEGDPRVAASSAYLPIPPDLVWNIAVPQDKAIANARLALAHYTEGPVSDPFPPASWLAKVQPYLGRPIFVLPFAGHYRLAYELLFIAIDQVETWSVFVDAQTGEVLGRPGPVGHRAQVFDTSSDVQPPRFTPLPAPYNAQVNPAATFMDVRYHDINGQFQNVDCTQNPGPGLGTTEFAAINVAYHSALLYDYLKNLAGRPNPGLMQPAQRVIAEVAESPIAALRMGFNPTTGVISYQHDRAAQGLDVEGKKVFAPAHDPEVIYHETAHALTWLVNPNPYRHLKEMEIAPFARSLVEGYAIYLARSFGESRAPGSGVAWAPAAYPSTPGQWGDQWALERALPWQDGADRLAPPNLYPIASVPFDQFVRVYEVGMVMARALWALRGQAGVHRANEIDELAMDAFLKANGWVTSFEIIGEGLVEARQIQGLSPAAIISILRQRGILANQTVQTLAVDGQTILVGADAGLMRSLDGGQIWSRPQDEKTEAGVQLTNVVALANIGPSFYAATETNVYHYVAGNQRWKAVGVWPLDQRPICLTAASNGRLYVGTGQSVFAFDGAGWTEPKPLLNVIFGVALRETASPAGEVQVDINAAAFNVLRRLPAGAIGWEFDPLEDELTDLVTCVLTMGADVFVGTVTVGVWKGVVDATGALTQITRLDQPNSLQAAVLCLAADGGGRLYVGTTQGVFEFTQAGRTFNDPGSPMPTVSITALGISGDRLFVGTATDSLFMCSRDPVTQQWLGNWTPVVDVQNRLR